MEIINNVKIFKSGRIDMDTASLGRQNEKNVTKLIFSFPEELDSYNKTIEFSFGGDKKIVDIIFNNEYVIDNNISSNLRADIQITCTDIEGTEVFKSSMQSVAFENSINAVEPAPSPEDVSIWNKMITALNEKIEEVDEIKIDGDYAKEQGDYAKGEAEKVDSVVEYVTNTSEEAKEIAKTAESIAKGANQCKTYGDYPTFIEAFNLIPKDKYNVGQDVRIVQVNVPDIWVAYIEEESVEYVYTTDEAFVEELTKNGTVQVGYYKFGMLETQKVNLTEYVKDTDYATTSKAGVIKTEGSFGALTDSVGRLYINPATTSEIDAKTNKRKPIVPENLDYAVKSVVGGHITLTQAEYDELVTAGTIDENTYYYIKEE